MIRPEFLIQRRCCPAIAVAVFLLANACTAEDDQPSIGQSLAELPKTISDVEVAVPEPSLPDGLDSESQQRILTEVAGRHSLDRFMKDSIVAPFTLKRTSIKDADGNRVGHQVDLWFVAYGPLSAIADKNLFLTMIDSGGGADDQGSGQALTRDDLAKRGIQLAGHDEPDGPIAYYRFTVPVLDRVELSGVAKRFSRVADQSHFASVVLEPAFEGDDDFPNQWRHVRRGEVSQPDVYRDCGGYAKATVLVGHPGAMLIECHAVLAEPPQWFGGPNLLGSKLPLAVQNTVRKFRRTLVKHR